MSVLKIENPKLFALVSLLFIFSLLLLIFGINSIRLNLKEDGEVKPQELKVSSEDSEDSLSDIFENAGSSSEAGGTDEYFLEKDPFKDVCAETSGDGQVSVPFGTVCYR